VWTAVSLHASSHDRRRARKCVRRRARAGRSFDLQRANAGACDASRTTRSDAPGRAGARADRAARAVVRRARIPYARPMRKRSGAVVCPGCGRLVDVSVTQCPYCGRSAPGLYGYGPALQKWFGSFDLSFAIIAGCVALYVVTLLLDPRGIFRMAGMFDILAPTSGALSVMGMTGAFALAQGRWWTVLTAIFLHGSLLHLLFNLVITRQYLPHVVELYGAPRAWLIFVVAGVVGFVFSNLAVGVPTIGASGAIFGLLAAMIVYGRRTRQSHVTQQLWMSAAMMFLFGFLMPSVNNWAHAGGFAGGFVAAEALAFSDRRENPWLLALSWGSAVAVLGAFGLQVARLVRALLGI
jgi:rhomboid protease GluP